jgi:hypothetical protein
VEGASDSKLLRRQSDDRIRRIIVSVYQLGCRDTNHGHSMFFEPEIAALIPSRAISHIMAYPINLNRQIRFRAIELEHVGSHRMLAPEYRLSRDASTQSVP